MICVYDSRETNFEHNGLAVLRDCKSCFITQEINGAYYLELEHVIDARGKYKLLEGWNIIKADGQLFRIPIQSKIQSNGLSIKVRAEHIFYDLSNDYTEDTRSENQTVQQALTKALQINPKFTIGTCDNLGTNTAYFIGENPVASIFQKILPRWGGEIHRDNFTVAIKNKLGADNGVSVAYGKNILGFEQTIDRTNMATRIKPIGKDGMTIESINGNSKYLSSPRVNDYPFVITKEIKFDNIEDIYELKAAAEALWGNIDLPLVNYKVNFQALEKVKEYELIKNLITLNIGDIVTIKHKIFNIDIQARVIKIVKNVLNGKIQSLELGQFKNNLADKFRLVDDNIAQTQQELGETKQAVNGAVASISVLNGKISLVVRNDNTIDGDALVSSINLSDSKIELSALNIDLSGFVTFLSLLQAGATTINGANIETGTLSLNALLSNNPNPIIRLFGNCSLDATDDNEQGQGTSIRLKWDENSYIKIDSTEIGFFLGGNKVGHIDSTGWHNG